MFELIMQKISIYAIPCIVLFIVIFGMYKKVKVYEVFCEGAKDGFYTAIKIIPFLVAMLIAIGVFRSSGAIDFIVKGLSPILNTIGMPGEVFPLTIMRPLSGGGSSGLLVELFKTHGPDSLIGRMASIMMGSTETTFYVIAVYFGAVSIRKTRHAVAAGLIADLAGILSAIWIANIMFG